MMLRAFLTAFACALCAMGLAQVPRGTEVRLLLLKNLNSGGSVVGEGVPFLVTEDVVVRGRVVVREGTFALGVVKQARREGAFSAMVFDKPSRLAVEILQTWDVSGRTIDLTARMNGRQRELIHFNRENTKPKKLDRETEKALNSPHKRKVLEDLVDALKGSRSIAEVQDNAERGFIMAVARALRLESTADLLLNNRIMELVTLGAALSSPSLTALKAAQAAFGAATTTLRAVKEVAHIATHMPGFLSRKFGGRNIDARVGLEMSVFAESQSRESEKWEVRSFPSPHTLEKGMRGEVSSAARDTSPGKHL